MQTSLCGAINHSKSNAFQKIVGVGEVELAQYMPDRVCLMFGQSSADYWVYPTNEVAANVGFRVKSTAEQPLVISLQTHGDLVRHAWHAVAPGGNITVSVAESMSTAEG